MIYVKLPNGEEYDIEHTAKTAVIAYWGNRRFGKAMFNRRKIGKFIIGCCILKTLSNGR